MQSIINNAMNSLNRGEFQQALDNLIKINKLQPKNPQFWHLRAVSERKLGLTKASEKHFIKALKLAPNQPEILNAYANLLKQLNKYTLAKQQFGKAILNNPKYIDPYINLGHLLYADASYIEAEKQFKLALSIKPNNLNALVGLAKCYRQTMELEQAKNILLTILNDNPKHIPSHYLLGQIEKDHGSIMQAKVHFQQILSEEKHNIEATKALASCYLIDKEVDLSIQHYEVVIQKSPLDYDAHHQLSLIKWSKSLPVDACFSNYETAIENTQSTDLMAQYATKLLLAKKYTSAINIADKILTQKNNEAAAFIVKSHALRELGEFEEAVAISTFGLKKNKNHLALLYEQGHAHIADGNGNAALKLFEQLCKYDQDNLSCVTLKSTSLKMLDKTIEYNKICDPNQFIYATDISPESVQISSEQFNHELNTELVKLHNSKKHPLDQSLINGTQTIGDLFPAKSHYINLLDIEIKKAVELYINRFNANINHPFLKHINKEFLYQGSWSVLLQKQGFHKNHYHSEGWVSGAYYNQIPTAVDKGGEGWIEFGIPEFNMRHKLQGDYAVKPQNGLLVLFPSYFWHGTRAFTSDETRMTVAFDVIPKTLK